MFLETDAVTPRPLFLLLPQLLAWLFVDAKELKLERMGDRARWWSECFRVNLLVRVVRIRYVSKYFCIQSEV